MMAQQHAHTPTQPDAWGPSVRVGLIAITRHGVAQALRLSALMPHAQLCTSAKFAAHVQGATCPVHICEGPLSAHIGPLMQQFDQLVWFVSLGAVVRLIAPHLTSKESDPGIIVVDEAAQFVIAVLSGHVGGANVWSEHIAALLGAVPVLTTASDVGRTIAVDILGRELGWQVQAPKINITRVSAHVVNGEPIAVVQDAGSPHWWTRPTPLPSHIHCFTDFDAVDLSQYRALLWITHAPIPPALWQQLHERLVVYRPPQHEHMPVAIAIGLGCDRGTPLSTVQYALDAALKQAGVTLAHVRAVASITLKADEVALQSLAQQHNWQLRYYSPAQLAAVQVPNPSETVRRYTGTPSVSEAAALLAAAHVQGQAHALAPQALMVEKFKHRGPDGRNATVSIAKI